MTGGFLCVELTGRAGMPFLLTLPAVFVAVGLLGAAMERLLYRRLYRRSHLDQVLFTIGLAFMAGGSRDLGVGTVAATGAAAGVSSRADHACSASISAPTGCSSSRW